MSRALFAALACFAASANAQTHYFSGAEDLPLAPGLNQTAPAIWFADANGRIMVAAAHGAVEPDAIGRFYRETLPALGWSLSPGAGGVDGQVFLRGRERLTLSVSQQNGRAELSVQLVVRTPLMDAN